MVIVIMLVDDPCLTVVFNDDGDYHPSWLSWPCKLMVIFMVNNG